MSTIEQATTPTDTGPRPARLAVTAIFFINGALVANWFARIPDVKHQLGLSEGSFSIALLCMAVGALISQPAAGVFIGKFGSRVITSIMALTFCVTIILIGFATSLPLLMAALLLFPQGLGGGRLGGGGCHRDYLPHRADRRLLLRHFLFQ